MDIDMALGKYTDQYFQGESIDLDYFKTNLTREEMEDFLELIPFIELLSEKKAISEFEKTFIRIDKIVEDNYRSPEASGFRSKNKVEDNGIIKLLDSLLEDEFHD